MEIRQGVGRQEVGRTPSERNGLNLTYQLVTVVRVRIYGQREREES